MGALRILSVYVPIAVSAKCCGCLPVLQSALRKDCLVLTNHYKFRTIHFMRDSIVFMNLRHVHCLHHSQAAINDYLFMFSRHIYSLSKVSGALPTELGKLSALTAM